MSRVLAGIAVAILVAVALVTPTEASAELAYAYLAGIGAILGAVGLIHPYRWGALPFLLGAMVSMLLSAVSGILLNLYGMATLGAGALLLAAFGLGVRRRPS